MITHLLSVIWGNKENAFIPDSVKGLSSKSLAPGHPIVRLQEKMGAHSVVLNHQVHGTAGHLIDHTTSIPSTLLTQEGDFLITDQPGIALGILTADCLPLILYSKEKHVVGLIHAGWKGATQGIIQQAINTLATQFSLNPSTLNVLCGPAAQVCCYEVKEDFYAHFKDDSHAQHCFEQRNNKLFFSLSAYVYAILNTYAIPSAQRDFSAHCCTICTAEYYSYRKDNKTKYRNITLVTLR